MTEKIGLYSKMFTSLLLTAAYGKQYQERRSRKTRKKQKSDGEKNMFAGLLVCADCGSNLWYHFNQANPGIEYFNCSGYNKGKRKICNSTHYIRVVFWKRLYLAKSDA